jgi:hypothetical protein
MSGRNSRASKIDRLLRRMEVFRPVLLGILHRQRELLADNITLRQRNVRLERDNERLTTLLVEQRVRATNDFMAEPPREAMG